MSENEHNAPDCEYIVTENEYAAACAAAYEAGAAGREVYTARDYLARPLMRCRDCRWFYNPNIDERDAPPVCTRYCDSILDFALSQTPDGFCAWGERKDAE